MTLVNDVPIGPRESINAKDIVKTLFDKGLWPFKEGSPNLKKLKINDRLLIYICGHKRRYFYGELELTSKIKPLNENKEIEQIAKKLGLVWMSVFAEFKVITVFDPPIKMLPLIESLSFITEKKNYGLNLRLPIIAMSKDDYDIIRKQNLK